MTTLFLKYRPKLFADLDSVEARDSLIKLFTFGNIPHALLFTGPRGIGKTSAARITAKSLVCEKNGKDGGGGYEPCNLCPACLSVDNGSHLDVLEIDAASNRGIDDARDLREKIRLSPAQGKYKIFIIDEVHMLTTESFNALLKTLEEPPKHVYFILCTTDFEKLPKTIVSRCTRIHFKKATRSEVINRLIKVAKAEKVDYDESGLEVLVRSCDGSFRDAIKLLEQSSGLGKITEDAAMKVVGLNNDFPIDQFLGLLEKRQVGQALDWINKAGEANVNFKLVIQEMVEKLRQLMLKSFGIQVDPGLPEYVFSLEQIRRLVGLLTTANYEMKQTPIASLPLEMAVIEFLGQINETSGNNNNVDEIEKTGEKTSNPTGETQLKSNKEDEDNRPKMVSKSEETTGVIGQSNKANVHLESFWQLILEEVKPLNHSVLAFLRASRPLSIDDKDNLTIEVFYKFHKDQLETDRCRRIFEQAAGKVLSRPVKLRCLLGEGKPLSVEKEETVYEVHLDSPLSTPQTDDIINLAEQIFNNGETLQ